MLDGVPTVVYGYFALLFVTPLLPKVVPGLQGFNMLAPGLVMGVMIMPYVSLAERGRHAGGARARCAKGLYAMGATRFQTALHGGDTGRPLGHHRRLHPGHVARHRRDHGGRHRRRAAYPG